MFLIKRSFSKLIFIPRTTLYGALPRSFLTYHRNFVLPAAFSTPAYTTTCPSQTRASSSILCTGNARKSITIPSRHVGTAIGKSKHGNQEVIYRFRWIKTFRFISRVKILHVLVVTGLTGPMCMWYSQGMIPLSVFLTSAVAATATTGGLVTLSYFFRRIVGVISLDENKNNITISTLTFWGNRRNITIPVTDLVPISDSGFDTKHSFHQLELYGSDFVYLLNLRHGEIRDKNMLMGVLGLMPTSPVETATAKPTNRLGK